jgi:two-component system sensor histidine kinase DegS
VKRAKRRSRRAITGSLRAQLMLTTVAPVAALLIALCLVGVFAFTRLTQTLVEERDSDIVQLAAQQVAGYWVESVYFLQQIALFEPVKYGDINTSQSYLSMETAASQRFDRVSVTNAQGIVVATKGGENGEDISRYEYFDRVRAVRRPVRSEVHEDARGRSIITVAVPTYDAAGQFSGCVLGTWELQGELLGFAVANIRVGENGFAYLVDSSGTILYHPNQESVGTVSPQHPAVAELLRGEKGARTINFDGETTVVGYAPIPMRHMTGSSLADETWDGWGLVTSELWRDIVAPLQPFVSLMLLLLVLVITLPLTVLAVNSKRIAAPLQSLAAQAERVASGEFDSQVSIGAGPTEVRELEVAFNRMVERLREYQRDIQNYVVSILNSQEDERKRIARELHDETAQQLIVLGRRIEMAEELSDDELTSELEYLRDMVDDTLQGVRRFTSDLRPPLLEELGLPRTLEILAGREERDESLRVDVTISGRPRQLLPELELALYRLAQESLSNVRRHAHASHVDLQLTYGQDYVGLEIRDNGVGFKGPTEWSELMKTGRLGLMGIHERARLFGGKATITSEPGQGTLVSILVPLTAIVLPMSDGGPSEAGDGGKGVTPGRGTGHEEGRPDQRAARDAAK